MIPLFLWAINKIGVRKEESESQDDAVVKQASTSSVVVEHEEGNKEERGVKTSAGKQASPSSTNKPEDTSELSVEHGGSHKENARKARSRAIQRKCLPALVTPPLGALRAWNQKALFYV